MVTNYGQFDNWENLYNYMFSNNLNIVKIFARDHTPARLTIIGVKQQAKRHKEGKSNV